MCEHYDKISKGGTTFQKGGNIRVGKTSNRGGNVLVSPPLKKKPCIPPMHYLPGCLFCNLITLCWPVLVFLEGRRQRSAKFYAQLYLIQGLSSW